MHDQGDITRLLEAAEGRVGPDGLNELFRIVYPQLRELARGRRARWAGKDTLSATALIHETYLKVAASPDPRFRSRGHFFASAARAMRQVLINYAEAQRAERRGGGAARLALAEDHPAGESPPEELLALDRALERLEAMSERQARVVECRFFAGLDVDETAEALDVSRATVKRDWSAARAWLYREMQSDTGATP
jgi:RNA polymerase sigma factor (TIGR02999 family)